MSIVTGNKVREIQKLLKIKPDKTTEKGKQVLKETFEHKEVINYCHFCYNAHVQIKEPVTEEYYFEPDIDDSNDGSSSGIGKTAKDFSIMLNSGFGKPCEIEFRQWGKNNMWHTVGYYYPKFCPECGRPLDEYKIDERGTSYERKRADRKT